MQEPRAISPRRLRQLRRRFSLLWVLFFLMLGLILVMTLLHWRRTLPPSQVVMMSMTGGERLDEPVPQSSAFALYRACN